LLPALVLVNAVAPTLREIGYPFVRINGWPGFLERSVHELVAPDERAAARVAALYERLDRDYRLVPDVPGMISARILSTIINEAFFTWEERVSTKEEIDTAMRLGTNYPLGPFEWSERIGLREIEGLLRALSRANEAYAPAEALVHAAGERGDADALAVGKAR
jgi:3-hydroxybutyryl-CoA dehydrogenase